MFRGIFADEVRLKLTRGAVDRSCEAFGYIHNLLWIERQRDREAEGERERERERRWCIVAWRDCPMTQNSIIEFWLYVCVYRRLANSRSRSRLSYAASRFDTMPPLGIRAADTPCFPCLRGPNGFLIREHRRVHPIRRAPRVLVQPWCKLPDNFPIVGAANDSLLLDFDSTILHPSALEILRFLTNCIVVCSRFVFFHFNRQTSTIVTEPTKNGFNRGTWERNQLKKFHWLALGFHKLISTVRNFEIEVEI